MFLRADHFYANLMPGSLFWYVALNLYWKSLFSRIAEVDAITGSQRLPTRADSQKTVAYDQWCHMTFSRTLPGTGHHSVLMLFFRHIKQM
jgi:hypothetical protein